MRVLVMGGSSSGRFPNEVIESSAEILDPLSGRFSATGSMTIPRYQLGAATFADGRVLVVGGSDNCAWRCEYSSAEIYDPATGRFARTGELDHKRYKLPASVLRLPNGQVLVAGGAPAPRCSILPPGPSASQSAALSIGNGGAPPINVFITEIGQPQKGKLVPPILVPWPYV